MVSGTASASAIPPTAERAISMATLSLVSTSASERLATENSSWFLKLNGDADAVSAARADFVTYLGTLHLE